LINNWINLKLIMGLTAQFRSATVDSVQPESGNLNQYNRSKLTNVLLMVALCIAVFLASLDTVLITTALPTIAHDFHISDSGYAWVGSAYLLSNAAFVPFWGKISDVFGRKPVLLVANAIFIAGSILSAMAPNLTALIAGRAVQGLGGGGIVILVNICVSDLFDMRYAPPSTSTSTRLSTHYHYIC
jgi:MFS family permease